MTAGQHAQYLWLNGAPRPWQEPQIHVTAMGASAHTSVFEGINAYLQPASGDLSIFRLADHLRRLIHSKIFGSETKSDDTDARLMARMGFLHELVGEGFSIRPVLVMNPDAAALRGMVHDLAKLQKEMALE